MSLKGAKYSRVIFLRSNYFSMVLASILGNFITFRILPVEPSIELSQTVYKNKVKISKSVRNFSSIRIIKEFGRRKK